MSARDKLGLIKHDLRAIFGVSFMLYVFLFAYNSATGSQWWLDALISGTFLAVVFSLRRWLRIGYVGFILFNIALLLHNMGTFGWYEMSWAGLGYDNIVHFVSSAVAAYITFNFIAYKLHIRQDKRLNDSQIDEHVAILIFLVMASVAAMGMAIEIMEFGGYALLGEGEGILFAGAGDSDGTASDGNYIDTMGDILVNTLGSIIGTLTYYFGIYKKKPWLKYY